MDIELTQGKVTQVDPEDYAYLFQYKWWTQKVRKGVYYANRSIPFPGSNRPNHQQTLSMHRAITGLCYGNPMQVDHINHDTLDNRRNNLRVVTRRENNENRLNQSSLGVGIQRVKDSKINPYSVRVSYRGKQIHIGRWPTIEAAREVRAKAVRLMDSLT